MHGTAGETDGVSVVLFSPVAARYDGGGAGGRHRACGKDRVHLREVDLGFGFFLA
jgi:hypothetical protein